MDDVAADPYVQTGMNLLMLLSALLSALTGVGAVVRRPEVAQAVAPVAVSAEAARGTTVAATSRPIATLPTLVRVAALRAAPVLVLAPTVAPWANRRRE